MACRLKSLVFGNYFYIALLQDQLGIIARISKCIASRGANILNVDLYIDFDGKRNPVFYARRYGLFVFQVFGFKKKTTNSFVTLSSWEFQFHQELSVVYFAMNSHVTVHKFSA